MARAKPTRRRIPPESWAGIFSAASPSRWHHLQAGVHALLIWAG
jgi:hypothetical protein